MRWRKTPRPRVWVGNLLGVTVTDAGGYAAVEPFPHDPDQSLDGTGHFSTPVTAARVSAVGYWTPITNGDPLSPEILFDAEGDCVVGWVPTPGGSGDGGATAGSGGVIGPGSATDGALAAFNGTTGQVLRDSGVLTAGGHLGVGGAPDADAVATFAGQYYSPLIDDGSSGAATTIDWNLGNEHILDLTASCTLTFSHPVQGGRYVLLVRQTGAFTITWPAAVRWAGGTTPTITATAGKLDLFTFIYVPGGTPVYLGSYNQNY